MHENDSDRERKGNAEPAAEAVLDWLNRDVTPPEAAEDPLAREHLEVLGSLPYALEEIPPPARVKESLLRAISGSGSEPAPGEPDRAGTNVVPIAPSSRPRATRWILPLAAGLALMVGLAARQQVRVGDQQATIERLAGRLSETNRATAQLADMQVELEEARSKLAMVTSQGVEVCALEPVGDGATHVNSRGALFVASDHQHWYLKIDGLEPCPMGRVYQLWFVGPDGRAFSAGTFEVESGVHVELTSETMPEGTRAVKVTLEPRGGSEQPTGPEVLLGDEVTRVL